MRPAIVVALVALAALAALAVLLLLAPPASNWVWAVNGFRSVGFNARLGLLAAAAGLWVLARGRSDSRLVWTLATLFVAIVVAVPLHERTHLLGDTEIRIRSIAAFNANLFGLSFSQWSHELHAQPLDIAVGFFGPILWQRLGHNVMQGVQLVSLLQALAFFAVIWTLSGRLQPPAGSRVVVCLVLVLSGVLEAFAGYAESAGLLLVTGAWWWSELLAPLDRRSRALRMVGVWFVLLLAHRQALALLPVMAVRGLRASHPNDTPAARRELLIGSGLACIAAAGLMWLSAGGQHLGGDAADFGGVLAAWTRGRRIPAVSDLLNIALLVAPAGVVAIALSRDHGPPRRPVGSPGWLYAVAALSLTPLLVTVVTGPHELGAHRDWDTAVLLGLTGTLASVGAILRLPAARARGVLAACVPVFALLAGGWVAVNAEPEAVDARAAALATQPPRMEDEQLSALEVFLGDRDMSRFQAAPAGPHFERAYALTPNPRLLLLAAEARARAADFAQARADVDRAWKSGGLNERNQQSARTLSRMIDELERAHSAQAKP